MPVKDTSSGPCPIGRAADVLGDRWSLLIMRNAVLGQTRFDQFRNDLGIADNILSARLARLIDAGLLTKAPYLDGNRTRQHYVITPAGVALRPVFEALSEWACEFVNPAKPATMAQTVHTPCGQISQDRRHCATCETDIEDGDVAWLLPWLSPSPLPLATAGPTSAG
ncbi:winged helix-turn-helix transcriptional regulator [Nocardia sp. NPDC060256]|uniref:winged helix-turn-helix transcriptional regulator n=1 Tax=unclassified Nocardia TaxID=2637762 RepID=UPI0036652326